MKASGGTLQFGETGIRICLLEMEGIDEENAKTRGIFERKDRYWRF
jgi:hypothetical protein